MMLRMEKKMQFDKKKLEMLAGLGDPDDRWVIVEGDDKECKCKDKENCKCGLVPPGFSEYKVEHAEESLAELTEDELREFIRAELIQSTKPR